MASKQSELFSMSGSPKIRPNRGRKPDGEVKNHTLYMRMWRERNYEKYLEVQRRHTRRYNARRLGFVSVDDFPVKPHSCEICGSLKKLVVDHDHTTGRFRGWICGSCNSAIGFSRESEKILLKIVQYLRDRKS